VVSIWHLAQRAELLASPRRLHEFARHDKRHTVVATDTGLWLITEWVTGARVAFRVAFSPRELSVDSIAVDREADSIHVEMSSTIGQQTASIGLDRSDGTISASVTLKPVADLTVAGWPRDVIPDLDHVEGTVHTSQRGLRTGLVHACVNSPVSGSFMYLQDLTVLGDYFQATHASAKDTVSGEWPDLGFALPSGDKPLKKGEPARISSWHVAFTDQACEEPAAVAEQYL
jgi:hypothetical protein